MNYSQSGTNSAAGSSRTEHAAANAHHQHSTVFSQYQSVLSRPAFQSSLCNRSVKMGTSYFTADPNCRFPNSNGSFKCDSNIVTESGSKWLYGNHVVDYPLNLLTNNSTSQSIVYMPHHRNTLHSCDSSSSSLRFQTPAKNQSVLQDNCESSDSVVEGSFIEKFSNFSLNKVTTSAEVGRVDFDNTLSNRYDVFDTSNIEYSQFNAVSASCNTLTTTSSLYNYTGKDHQGNNCFVEHDCINGVTYFYSNEGQKSFPYDGSATGHYLYNGAPSYLSNPAYCKSDASCFSVCAELKAELQARQQLNCPHSYSYEYHDVPQKVDNYYKLLPLEEVTTNPMMQQNGYFCLVTTTYKAVSADDGLYYCLRRLHGFRVVNSNALSAVYQWKTKVSSPNVVGVKEAFTNKAFGDNSLIFVFDYYPGAETLKSRHFSSQKQCKPNNFQDRDNITAYDPTSRNPTMENKPIAESLLWSYVINICSALRVIHSAGLAARTIDPSKILVVGKSRILLNCCAIFDVLTFEQMQSSHVLITRYQQDDLVGLGQLIFSLACGNLSHLQQANFASSMEFLSRHYSADLKNLILYLLHGQRSKNVMEIMPMIGARFFSHLDSWLMRVDMLENELIKEMENGRLFRILCKLATINERPVLGMDPQWSETGDRYLLKLFRDYVFHQVTEDGSPWLDLGHIVQCLNKLDAGVAEKIMLMSRDEQNVLIVSFADLHRCLDQSFTEIVQNTCQGVTS